MTDDRTLRGNVAVSELSTGGKTKETQVMAKPIDAGNAARAALAIAAVALLAACGGGGGGGTSGSSDGDGTPETGTVQSRSKPPLNPAAAAALTDSSPPAETVADQAAREAALFDRFDSLIVSTLYGEIQGERFIFASDCQGTGCTLSEPITGFSITMTLEDLRDTESEAGRSRAVLTKNGVTLVETRVSGGGVDGRTYGSWLDHGAFQVEAGIGVTTDNGVPLTGRGASVGGDLTGSRPVEAEGVKSAKWRGLMVGTPARGDRRDNILQGDAELNYRFETQTLDAEFTGIADLDRNVAHTVPEVRFVNVPVAEDGTYGAGGVGNRIQGGFAGPDHAETAGIFEQRNIVGAFGAKKTQTAAAE